MRLNVRNREGTEKGQRRDREGLEFSLSELVGTTLVCVVLV